LQRPYLYLIDVAWALKGVINSAGYFRRKIARAYGLVGTIATLILCFACQNNSATGGKAASDENAGVLAVQPDSKERLSLGHAELIPGSTVLRADLFVGHDTGFSSGKGFEIRNILFIDPSDKAARWLLPDHDHVVAQTTDITDDKELRSKRTIATAVFVKAREDERATASGQLLLVDGMGRKIVEVANDVRDIHIATLDAGEVIVLFERNRRLVLATFDPTSIVKKREQEIELPQLK
jgi:hypothetical protein